MEECRLRDPPQAENPASQDSFLQKAHRKRGPFVCSCFPLLYRVKKYGQEGSYAPNYTSPAETLSKSVPLIEEITVTFHGGIELKNVAVDQIGIGRVFEPGIGIVQLPFGELQIVSQGFFWRF